MQKLAEDIIIDRLEKHLNTEEIIISGIRYMVEVRKQTFDDILNEIKLMDLPVVFRGTFKECKAYCEKQEGFVWKDSKMQLAGGYYYNKDEATYLLLI